LGSDAGRCVLVVRNPHPGSARERRNVITIKIKERQDGRMVPIILAIYGEW
jgi:hypothetical protein